MIATPREAAAIILLDAAGRVLVGERGRVPFLPGFLSFPGGRVEDEDAALIAGAPDPDDPPTHAARGAALRELAEETGLLATSGAGLRLIPPELRGTPLPSIYRALGVDPPRADELPLAGRWITPPSAPMRFDTRFFLARAAGADVAPAPSGEFAWARFMFAGDVFASWRRLELLLSPPTRAALAELAASGPDLLERLVSAPSRHLEHEVELEPMPGISMLPLRTPTLPPATHTNTYLLGRERVFVVDPATYEEEEREKLWVRLENRIRGGAVIAGVVLTHHHTDHVGAAEWLRARTGAPIFAHERTRALLEGRISVDHLLAEGDHLRPDEGFELLVLHTPGHAPGHVVLVDRRPGARAMIAGDMVASIGTIIIDPPEGDMSEYLRQLERLRDRGPSVLFPAHGQPITDGQGKLEEYLQHRAMRELKVLAALEAASAPSSPEDLLPIAYDDTPPFLYGLAARSCLAHLEKLAREGRAVQEGARFRPGRALSPGG